MPYFIPPFIVHIVEEQQNDTSIIKDSIAIESSDIEKLKPLLRWGTFGPSGKDPLTYVRLVDCSSDHLHTILKTQPCGDVYKTVIRSILKERQYEILSD